MEFMKIKNSLKLVISLAVPQLAGIVGALFTTPSISSGWYAGLAKPALNPPSWIFGPVWTGLYAFIGLALFLVWKNDWKVSRSKLPGFSREVRKPWNPWSRRLWDGDLQKFNIISVFAVQLLLNASWSVVFFGMKRPDAAFFVLIALWCAIIYTIANFYRVSRAAAWLLLPYLLWVTFAGYLNYSIWMLNERAAFTMDPRANKMTRSAVISTPKQTVPVKLYYYNPELDQGPGGVQCTREGLVAVDRLIPQTNTPVEDTIRLLLQGGISEEERVSGITSEYPLSGLYLRSAVLTNGELTLSFDDPENRTSGGSCRAGILWFQVEATAKQFPEIKNVRFLP